MGPIGLKLVAAPAAEPVSLGDAKARLRVSGSDEDADILALIAEAREAAEGECGRQFVTATYALYLDRFPLWWDSGAARNYVGFPRWPFAPPGALAVPEIRLPRPPCQSVSSITYYDTAGVLQTLASNAYVVAAGGEPARVVPVPGTYWPDTQSGRPEAVTVTFVAGYGGNPAAVPRLARAAILEIVAHRYKNRGDEAKVGIPATARRLLDGLEYGEVR